MVELLQRRQSRGNERGQGLVEFAFVFPILILFLMAVADLGLMFLTTQTVKQAGREGARMAVKLDDLEVNDQRVIDHVESLIPNTDFFSGFNGGTTVAGSSDCSSTDQVTVTVSGDYHFVALNILGLDKVPLSFPTTMRYELCE